MPQWLALPNFKKEKMKPCGNTAVAHFACFPFGQIWEPFFLFFLVSAAVLATLWSMLFLLTQKSPQSISKNVRKKDSKHGKKTCPTQAPHQVQKGRALRARPHWVCFFHDCWYPCPAFVRIVL